MVYNVMYERSVERHLKKLSKVEATKVLDQLEKELSKEAHLFPALKGRFAELRKHWLRDCGVTYTLKDENVLVLRIRHRKSVYRKGV